MERSKTASYLGFARRAGKLTLGVNAAATLKKGVYLLVADETVAKNSRKEIEKLRTKFSCPLIYIADLGMLVGKEGCKLAVVRDAELAKAVLRAQESAGGSDENISR